MVLVDDKFSALPKAIIEGKKTVTGMRDILRLYLTRNYVLAILVAVLLLALGRFPMLPVHNAFYALASVSFAAFLMAIWAKPSNNKTMILPGVLRFSIPMAVMIAGFGLAVYAIFYYCTMDGTFELGQSFYDAMYAKYGGPYSDFGEFWEHMTPSDESVEEVTARNAMLVFIILAGIAQMFFIYPLAKFYSVDGTVSKDLKPTILALLLFGLVVLVYMIPQVSVGVASLAIFPKEFFLLITGIVVIWFFFAVLFMKSRLMRKVADQTESHYKRSLGAEIEKEE